MKQFVWDTSALLSIREPNSDGYSAGRSLFKDLADGWIAGPYKNIFPAIAAFELEAAISRKNRDGEEIVRGFYIVDDNAVIYPIDQSLIRKCASLVTAGGFTKLRGADLIFACIAHVEDAYLVTLDNHFAAVAHALKVINLNESRSSPAYRRMLASPEAGDRSVQP